MTDEIVMVENGAIRSLPARSFRQGLLGKTLEDSLQYLIEKHPQLIPGGQIAPGREEPPRFALLCREMRVGSWSLDFLLVDQYGVPTLIEAKLAENPESRRAVIGQIIEYATNAAEAWSGGKLREKASAYWRKNKIELETVINELTGDIDSSIDTFWDLVEKNLSENRIRLIIAADELRPEVRKIIEFLNEETKNIEILGLEIKCFCEQEDTFALVPTIIGQSQAVADKKTKAGNKTLWNYQELNSYLDQMDDQNLSGRLKTLLDWAKEQGVLIELKNQYPSFGIKGKYDSRIMTVWNSGRFYCMLNDKSYGNNLSEKNSFVEALNQLSIFDYQPEDVADGRNSSGLITDLSDTEFSKFIEILSEHT